MDNLIESIKRRNKLIEEERAKISSDYSNLNKSIVEKASQLDIDNYNDYLRIFNQIAETYLGTDFNAAYFGSYHDYNVAKNIKANWLYIDRNYEQEKIEGNIHFIPHDLNNGLPAILKTNPVDLVFIKRINYSNALAFEDLAKGALKEKGILICDRETTNFERISTLDDLKLNSFSKATRKDREGNLYYTTEQLFAYLNK